MSALSIRAHIHALDQHYLCPLAQTGSTAEEMPEWVESAHQGKCDLQKIYVENDQGERKLLSKGYEFECLVVAEFDGEHQEWTERVLVVQSENTRKCSNKPRKAACSVRVKHCYP